MQFIVLFSLCSSEHHFQFIIFAPTAMSWTFRTNVIFVNGKLIMFLFMLAAVTLHLSQSSKFKNKGTKHERKGKPVACATTTVTGNFDLCCC